MPSEPDSIHLANVTLVKEQRSRVRDLQGFRKGHQIPTESTEHTNSFVGRIAAEDLAADLETRFADFRKLLKFKRIESTGHRSRIRSCDDFDPVVRLSDHRLNCSR
jgi:hypothetical protein